eukprot:TRINITY_DN66727_c6_g1_i2.p1 TRINITY_DN66727_c6_g1~~TRINITY_DN66727_c6_g1_i2.p1  ORF type:complete len:311 (-),score=35.90 TRINITY_DN66727_c6_g1_i2:406-1338(-)
MQAVSLGFQALRNLLLRKDAEGNTIPNRSLCMLTLRGGVAAASDWTSLQADQLRSLVRLDLDLSWLYIDDHNRSACANLVEGLSSMQQIQHLAFNLEGMASQWLNPLINCCNKYLQPNLRALELLRIDWRMFARARVTTRLCMSNLKNLQLSISRLHLANSTTRLKRTNNNRVVVSPPTQEVPKKGNPLPVTVIEGVMAFMEHYQTQPTEVQQLSLQLSGVGMDTKCLSKCIELIQGWQSALKELHLDLSDNPLIGPTCVVPQPVFIALAVGEAQQGCPFEFEQHKAHGCAIAFCVTGIVVGEVLLERWE